MSYFCKCAYYENAAQRREGQRKCYAQFIRLRMEGLSIVRGFAKVKLFAGPQA